MTIYRFNLALVLLVTLSACEIREESASSDPSNSEDTEKSYQPKILRDAKKELPAKLLKDFQDNPNRFAIDNDRKKFRVQAKIQNVPEFTDHTAKSSGYYLPLLVREDMSEADRFLEGKSLELQNLPRVESIAIFLIGFSKEKAATLNRDQDINVHCKGLRIIMDGLVFDDCKLRDEK